MPSAFTLGNLFFGFWAIVSASQGNFLWAGWFVMFAGVLDMLDGRLARKRERTGPGSGPSWIRWWTSSPSGSRPRC